MHVLYTNIDQTLPNKLHGPMHYKIGVTCVYNGHLFYTLLKKKDNLIHLFHNSTVCVMDSGQCLYTIHNDTLSGEFRCVLGVRQGELLSSLLFSM